MHMEQEVNVNGTTGWFSLLFLGLLNSRGQGSRRLTENPGFRRKSCRLRKEISFLTLPASGSIRNQLVRTSLTSTFLILNGNGSHSLQRLPLLFSLECDSLWTIGVYPPTLRNSMFFWSARNVSGFLNSYRVKMFRKHMLKCKFLFYNTI